MDSPSGTFSKVKQRFNMADACTENKETNVYFEALDASKIPTTEIE
jgi:hypothetical protein